MHVGQEKRLALERTRGLRKKMGTWLRALGTENGIEANKVGSPVSRSSVPIRKRKWKRVMHLFVEEWML